MKIYMEGGKMGRMILNTNLKTGYRKRVTANKTCLVIDGKNYDLSYSMGVGYSIDYNGKTTPCESINSILERTHESTYNNGFGDKIETFYIRGVNQDFRVIKSTFGAYDVETGAELVGMGAEVSINEITDHSPETIQNIITDVADGGNEWTQSDDIIMNTAPAVRSFIYTTTYDSPETADEITAQAILAVEANA